MRFKQIIFILLSFVFVVSGLEAQNVQKMIKKADKTYNLGAYAEAIPLYKELLLVKDNAAHRGKLADCYRLTNQVEDASEIYESILLTTSEKRIRPKVYLHYSEMLLNQGKYEKAEKMLEKYLIERPKDENAAQLKANISEISYIKPYYSDVEITPFSFNSSVDDYGAVFLDDGIVFTSDRPRGVALFKEKAAATGRDFLSLYFAPRTDRLEYGEPTILPNKINQLNRNTGPASFTKDGKTMVFSRNSFEESKKGLFTLQLFIAKRENGK
ncbi:MAG: tetratricopeptide repeat protein, partial [Saprospiraceae bacterium]